MINQQLITDQGGAAQGASDQPAPVQGGDAQPAPVQGGAVLPAPLATGIPDIDWKLFKAHTDAQEAVFRHKRNMDNLLKQRDQDRLDLEAYRAENERIKSRMSQSMGPNAHAHAQAAGSSQDHTAAQVEEPPAPDHEVRSSSVTFDRDAYMNISRRPRSLGRTLTRHENRGSITAISWVRLHSSIKSIS